jgi:hypothetical protein
MDNPVQNPCEETELTTFAKMITYVPFKKT